MQLASFYQIVAATADWVTIAAGAITVASLTAAYLARPRVTINTDGSMDYASIYVRHSGGMRPARHFSLGFTIIDAAGAGIEGSGADPWEPDLVPRGDRYIEFREGGEWSRRPFGQHVSFVLPGPDFGFICDIHWQASVLIWRRRSRVIVWKAEDRRVERAPRVLRGREARTIYKNVTGRKLR